MKAKVRDTEIYFDVEGMGLVRGETVMHERPVAMIIHGGPGMDHTGFKPSHSPLAEDMQLVYFDHRGQGRSARGDPTLYNLDENVEDMEALRQYLGLGPIVSIGTSYGGMVGLAHAARYPESVSKLILVATASHKGFNDRAAEIIKERATPAQQQACETLWSGAFRDTDELWAYFDTMMPMYSIKQAAMPAAPPAQGPRGPAILSHEAINRAFAPDGFLRSFDLRPELSRITAPTLILAGRHDWICAVEFSEEINRLIPQSELQIFEDSSHSLRTDQPERFMQAIKEFVAK